MTMPSRSDHQRSPMMARAMTDATMRNQIGQPAASMRANKFGIPWKWPSLYLRDEVSATAHSLTRSGNISRNLMQKVFSFWRGCG